MGQYKFTVSFTPWQLGALILYDRGFTFSIHLPLIIIVFGLMRNARGVSIFGKEF